MSAPYATKVARHPRAEARWPEHGSATSEPTVMPVSRSVETKARSSGGVQAARKATAVGGGRRPSWRARAGRAQSRAISAAHTRRWEERALRDAEEDLHEPE